MQRIQDNNNRRSVGLLPVALIFVAFLPNSFREIEIPLYIITGLASLYLSRGAVSLSSLVILIPYVCIHGTGILRNIDVSPTPDYIRNVSLAYLVGPIFWYIYSAALFQRVKPEILVGILNTLAVAVASQIIIYFLLYDQIPDFVKEALIYEPNRTLMDGVAVVRLHSIGSMIFLTGFALQSLPSKAGLRPAIAASCIWLLCGLAAVITGRTGLIAGASLSFIFVSTLRRKKHTWAGVILASLLSVGANSLGVLPDELNWKNIFDDHYDKIRSSGGEERPEQRAELMREFFESPVLGKGHGLQTKVLRDGMKPWRYELFYEATLYRVGLVGFIATVVPLFYSLYVLSVAVKRDPSNVWLSGILGGYVAILVAGATNPYFEAIDFQWMIIMPLAVALRLKQFKPKQLA